MTWETRLFFDIGDSEKLAQKMSLRNPAVVDIVAPGLQFAPGAPESRTDCYLLLPNDCPRAHQVGLKGRHIQQGRERLVTELKTVKHQHNQHLEYWTKEGRRINITTRLGNTSLMLEFLERYGCDSPFIRAVRDCIAQCDEPLGELQVHKQRWRTRYGSVCIEEMDVRFIGLQDNLVQLRSWAAEGQSLTDVLVKMSTSWPSHLDAAAKQIEESSPIDHWVLSYPGLLRKIFHGSEALMKATDQKEKDEHDANQISGGKEWV